MSNASPGKTVPFPVQSQNKQRVPHSEVKFWRRCIAAFNSAATPRLTGCITAIDR